MFDNYETVKVSEDREIHYVNGKKVGETLYESNSFGEKYGVELDENGKKIGDTQNERPLLGLGPEEEVTRDSKSNKVGSTMKTNKGEKHFDDMGRGLGDSEPPKFKLRRSEEGPSSERRRSDPSPGSTGTGPSTSNPPPRGSSSESAPRTTSSASGGDRSSKEDEEEWGMILVIVLLVLGMVYLASVDLLPPPLWFELALGSVSVAIVAFGVIFFYTNGFSYPSSARGGVESKKEYKYWSNEKYSSERVETFSRSSSKRSFKQWKKDQDESIWIARGIVLVTAFGWIGLSQNPASTFFGFLAAFWPLALPCLFLSFFKADES